MTGYTIVVSGLGNGGARLAVTGGRLPAYDAVQVWVGTGVLLGLVVLVLIALASATYHRPRAGARLRHRHK